jgi:hypothetical protein
MQSLANKSQSDYYFANGESGLGINYKLPWTPAAITTALWFDADDSSTITIATGVSQWNDKSGNGRNATQATGVNQPLLISNELNGKPVVRFDGTNDSLIYDGTFFANTSYTINLVITRRSNKVDNFVMAGSSLNTNRNLIVTWTNNTTFRFSQYFNDLDVTVPAYTSPIPEIWGVNLNTSVGRSIFKDGTLANSNTTTTALIEYPGARLGNLSFSGFWYNGDIAEIVATRSVLSTDNRQKIEGYLAWKWGLVSSLPNNHPYKNAVPIL